MHLIFGLAHMKIVTNIISGKVKMHRNHTVQYIVESLKQ